MLVSGGVCGKLKIINDMEEVGIEWSREVAFTLNKSLILEFDSAKVWILAMFCGLDG